MKKLPAGMVKSFLDADYNLRKAHISPFDAETPNFEGDIYQAYDGQLPLHLACFNNSSSEIIQLLLDKDRQNTTVTEIVDTSTESEKIDKTIYAQTVYKLYYDSKIS